MNTPELALPVARSRELITELGRLTVVVDPASLSVGLHLHESSARATVSFQAAGGVEVTNVAALIQTAAVGDLGELCRNLCEMLRQWWPYLVPAAVCRALLILRVSE